MPVLNHRPRESAHAGTAEREEPATGTGGLETRLRALVSRRVLGLDLRVALLVLPLLLWELYKRLSTAPGVLTHAPDSRYYMVMTLRDLGVPLAHAITRAYGQMQNVPVESWYFAHNDPSWAMVSSRVLYPALSAPFVALFGLNLGMMVVPVASVVLAVLATARTVQRVYGPLAAVVSVGALTTSVIFTRQQIVAYTDTLAVALMALLLCNLPIGRRATRTNLVFGAFLVVLGDLSRQIGPIPAGMVFLPWLWTAVRERRLRNHWTATALVVGGTAVVTQVVLLLLAPFGASSTFSQLHHAYTLGAEIKAVPGVFFTLLQQNASFAGRADPVLLALMGAALLFMVLRFRSETTAVFLGAFLGTELLGVLSVMSYLRYEMVAFPAMCLAAGGAVAALTGWGAERSAEPARRGDEPRRWLAALLACVLFLGGLAGWSQLRSPTTSTVAEYPSVQAAQGDQPYARTPVAAVPAEHTLQALFQELLPLQRHPRVAGLTHLVPALDWVHQVLYRPTGPQDPGWQQRAADGTSDFVLNALETPDLVEGMTNALTFDGTVDPGSVRVLSRTTSRYGEDTVFTVRDSSGTVHRGVATTLYPTRDTKAPGVVTRIVFQRP